MIRVSMGDDDLLDITHLPARAAARSASRASVLSAPSTPGSTSVTGGSASNQA